VQTPTHNERFDQYFGRMSPQKIAALGQTADILAQACGVPVAITDALREWDVGIFEGTADQRGWDMHHYGTIDHPYYGLLRLTPWRIELGNLNSEPIIWRRYAA